jgi:hypothetical protein
VLLASAAASCYVYTAGDHAPQRSGYTRGTGPIAFRRELIIEIGKLFTMSGSPAARSVARRLLARGMPKDGPPEAVAAAADYVFAHMIRTLSEWVGVAGCSALFARAIVLSEAYHPVLTGVTLGQSAPYLTHLGETAREYGSQATSDAAVDVLASVITMLSGLIGEDITMSLLEDVPPLVPENVHLNTSPPTSASVPHSAPGDAAS